jgi:PST family polysaccharide transporter
MNDRPRNLAKRSIAGAFWTSLAMGALAIAELVSLVVLARLLSPEDFGLFAAVLIFIRFSGVFGGLGVAPAIVQRPTLEESHLRVGFTLSILFSLSVAALVWATAPALAHVLHLPEVTPFVRAASFVFVFQGIAMVAQASAQRKLRFRWLAAVDAGAFAVGFVIVGPILALLEFGTWALIAALLTQNALRMVVLLASQPHPKRPMLERRAAADLMYFGTGFTLAKTCNYLASQTDRLVVGRWMGTGSLGVYSLISQLMNTPSVIFGNVLDRVLFPTMALVQSEPARLARAYRTGAAACGLVMLPAGVVLAALAPEVVHIMLGRGWADGVVPLQILAAGMLFRTSNKLSDSVARATGSVYRRAWRQAVYCCAVAIGALIGQFWGLPGVAAGVVLALASNFLLMAQLSLSVTGLSWSRFTVAHLPGLAQASVTGTLAWLLAGRLRDLGVHPALVLAEVGLAAGVTGIILSALLPTLFLGADVQSALRTTASLLLKLRRRSWEDPGRNSGAS